MLTRPNGRLTTLTHSNGGQLTIAYDADGRIQNVTDPNDPGTTADDRVTTYAYDASGQYLLSVTLPDSTATSYTYQTTGAAVTRHAMLSVTYSDGKHAYFDYDTRGRLTRTYGDANGQPVNYYYDSVGTVRIVDAEDASVVLRRGLTGEWSQLANDAANSTLRISYNDSGLTDSNPRPAGRALPLLLRLPRERDGGP